MSNNASAAASTSERGVRPPPSQERMAKSAAICASLPQPRRFPLTPAQPPHVGDGDEGRPVDGRAVGPPPHHPQRRFVAGPAAPRLQGEGGPPPRRRPRL